MTETPEEPQPQENPPTDQVPEASPATGDDVGGQESEALDRALQDAGSAEAGFSRGEALGAGEAAEIAAQRRATVIVLAGSTGSGKTTLLASLYERFGRGPLAGHSFDGSRTLHGFELRCHRSVYGLGPGAGDQGHTALEALPWLHLRVVRGDPTERIFELLLGDYSGEIFEALASGARTPSEYPQLRRADHLCIVLDGASLADPTRRAAEQREAVELLRALLGDPEGIAGAIVISIVVAKWDLILAGGEEARGAVEKSFAALQKELDEHGSEAPVGYIETAARSTSPELPVGHGVDDLLTRWTDMPAVQITHPPQNDGRVSGEIDRYRAGS